ncbi:MAG: hypothetical protein RR346_07815 [Bacteroidales bacterium]
MNALQNFAAQQLSKKQMNEVKGGAYFNCKISWDGGKTWTSGLVEATTADHAAAEVALVYLPVVEDTKIPCEIVCEPR